MQKYYLKAVFGLGLLALTLACGSRKKFSDNSANSNTSTTSQPTRPTPNPQANKVSWQAPMGDSIKYEMRAVWLTTAFGLDWPKSKADTPNGIRRQKEELERILDRLVADGYNTVFFQARLSGSVNYYSAEPFNRVFTSYGTRPAYDPLAFAVEACHRRGLTIHAWIVTYPLASSKGVLHPIARQNPRWAIAHLGSRHLDPGEPEVRSYIARLSADIARRYQVDGLHYDYFRYPEEAGRFNDNRSYMLYGLGLDKASWRRNNLTLQLKEIQDSVQRIRPELQLSVAPLGKLRKIDNLGRPHGWTAYDDVYQDVETWAKRGLVDFVAPMMYYKDLLYEPFLKDWQDRVGRYITVIPGLAPYRVEPSEKYPWQPEVIQEQIRLARRYKAGGVSMFREGNIGPRQPYLRTLIQREFKHTALVPPLKRGKNNPPRQPQMLQLRVQGKHLLLSWQVQGGQIPNVSYRVWATTIHQDGKESSQLLVQGLKTTQCNLRLTDLRLGERLLLGVEAVNALGVPTPCDKAVEFRLQQTGFSNN